MTATVTARAGGSVVLDGQPARTAAASVPLALSPGDAVAGTLIADDSSPTGIALTGARIVDPDAVTFGTQDLACSAIVEGPFDPRVLLNGTCTRPMVEGADVVVVPERTW